MFAVVENEGFTGVTYQQINQAVIDHHAQYGQEIIYTGRPVKCDIDGVPQEQPTKEDLKRKVTVDPMLKMMGVG